MCVFCHAIEGLHASRTVLIFIWSHLQYPSVCYGREPNTRWSARIAGSSARGNLYIQKHTFGSHTFGLPSWSSSFTRRPGLETRGTIAHRCHYFYHDCWCFCASISVLWRLCAGGLRVCRVPIVPVFQPAHSCHPFAWKRTWRLFSTLGVKPMSVSDRSYPRSTATPTTAQFGGAQ